ncbi:DoxX-like family protein [Paenibacillus harenae]|uniref:DoxX-like family protein n=1 Tax=Paenibacillus harenae TaxID=306543 RepID=UPI00278D7740|nr:DoxX-like family protein [Paenibacillus harenae]MDQ0057964.1 hypothetical protein [Paenibacillus harenae]
MVKAKPIYVELHIEAPLDEVWEHTQQPELHQQWDLRFSEIAYLPREQGEPEQHFFYRTRIGFGLQIEGTGITTSKENGRKEELLSTLSFSSEQAVSLIRHGGGYWSYKPEGNTVKFVTQYDYKTRFGWIGKLFDRFVFRPLFGFATAWSFDRLRIWLEHRVPPSVIADRALMHYASVGVLLLLWLYMGLIPKLIYTETSGELTIMQQTGMFVGYESPMIRLIGVLEIIFGIITALCHRTVWSPLSQACVLLLLTVPVCIVYPELLQSPFNPVTAAVPMLALCFASSKTRALLPNASRCIRKLPNTKPNGGNGR